MCIIICKCHISCFIYIFILKYKMFICSNNVENSKLQLKCLCKRDYDDDNNNNNKCKYIYLYINIYLAIFIL